MEEFLHPSDDLNEPLPPESQALLDRFKAYAVWHPRLLQVRTQVLDTVWEPADVVFVVVCGPSGVGKSKLAEVLTNRLNTPKPDGSGCVRMPEVGKPNSSMLTGKTAICRNWRVCQRSLPNNPILLLPRRRRPPIRRHASRRDISASHLPIEIKWE